MRLWLVGLLVARLLTAAGAIVSGSVCAETTLDRGETLGTSSEAFIAK